MKRLVFLILILNSFFCMAQGYAEDDYYFQQIAQSTDPYVLSEAIAYFEEQIFTLKENYQEGVDSIGNTVSSNYQHEFEALTNLQPKIWETDADFENRIRQLRGEIQKRLETELTLKKLDEQLDYEKRLIDLTGNYELAFTAVRL